MLAVACGGVELVGGADRRMTTTIREAQMGMHLWFELLSGTDIGSRRCRGVAEATQ